MRREHLVAAAVVATVVLAATSLGSGGPSPFVDDGGASSRDDRRMIVDDAHDPATTLEASESGKQTIEDRTPLGALARSRHRQLTDDELAILRDLEPEAFRAVPPAGGTWDQTSKNPCFFVQAKVDNRECMPYYHVVGAWQSGGRALNAKISMHPDVFQSGETHFWNEDRPMRAYLDRYDAFERAARARQNHRARLIVGDDSPGVLANTWTESQRLHRAFKDTVATCWKACQALPETVPHGAPAGSPTERRRCVDGDAENNILGCGAEAAKADPPREKPGGHALSVPHLMRAVYGDRDVKIIAVLREPVARLHAAYSHYEHYAKRFGDGARGFDEFVNLFVDAFEECAGEHGVEGCAHRFEAYHPKYEAVFYHADQLIKTMYATFLEGWLAMFGAENVLALRTEDVFHSDPAVRKTQLKKALDHLGLGDVADDAMLDAMDACDEECNADDAAMATKTFTVDQVRPSTREKLDAFFKPQLADLAAMLGDDKWRWPEYVGG